VNHEQRVERLAERGRLDAPDGRDVSERVMAEIRSRRQARPVEVRGLAWVAGFAVATLLPLGTAATITWGSWADPLLGVLYEVPWGMP